MRFPSHTPDTATGKAADLLGDILERHGAAGTMVRTMAGSASVLAGYLDLSRAMKRSKLDRQLSERISLAVQDLLGCGLCLQAHTSAARALGISEDEITRARQGGSADARINAIVDFGRRVYTDPSSVSDDAGAITDDMSRSREEALGETTGLNYAAQPATGDTAGGHRGDRLSDTRRLLLLRRK